MPLRFGGAGAPVAPARHDEEQIPEAVQVAHQAQLDRLDQEQGHGPALGPAADGARDVQFGPERGAARQHEARERGQLGVEPVDPAFERGHVLVTDALLLRLEVRRGGSQFGPDVEEPGLDRGELGGQPAVEVVGANHAQRGIQLVHAAAGLHSRRVLEDPPGAQQSGGAIVAGAGVDPHGAAV